MRARSTIWVPHAHSSESTAANFRRHNFRRDQSIDLVRLNCRRWQTAPPPYARSSRCIRRRDSATPCSPDTHRHRQGRCHAAPPRDDSNKQMLQKEAVKRDNNTESITIVRSGSSRSRVSPRNSPSEKMLTAVTMPSTRTVSLTTKDKEIIYCTCYFYCCIYYIVWQSEENYTAFSTIHVLKVHGGNPFFLIMKKLSFNVRVNGR